MFSSSRFLRFCLGNGLEIVKTVIPENSNKNNNISRQIKSSPKKEERTPKFCIAQSSPKNSNNAISDSSASFFGFSADARQVLTSSIKNISQKDQQGEKLLLPSSEISGNKTDVAKIVPPSQFMPIHAAPFLKQVRSKLEGQQHQQQDQHPQKSNHSSNSLTHSVSRNTSNFTLQDVDETLKILSKLTQYLKLSKASKSYFRYMLYLPVHDKTSVVSENDLIITEDDVQTMNAKSHKNILVLLERRVAFALSQISSTPSTLEENSLLTSVLYNLHQLSKQLPDGFYEIFDVSLVNYVKNWRNKFLPDKQHRKNEGDDLWTSENTLADSYKVEDTLIPFLTPSQMQTSDVAKTLVVLGEQKISMEKSRTPIAFAQEMLKLLANRIEAEKKEITTSDESNNGKLSIRLKPAAAASILEAASYYELTGGEAETLCENLLDAEGIATKLELTKSCSLFKALVSWKDSPFLASSALVEALTFRLAVSVPTTPDEEEELISCFQALLESEVFSTSSSSKSYENFSKLMKTMLDVVDPLIKNKVRNLNTFFNHVDEKTFEPKSYWAQRFLPDQEKLEKTNDPQQENSLASPTSSVAVPKQNLLPKNERHYSIDRILTLLNLRSRRGLTSFPNDENENNNNQHQLLDLKRCLLDLQAKRIRSPFSNPKKQNYLMTRIVSSNSGMASLSRSIEFIQHNPELLSQDPMLLQFYEKNKKNKIPEGENNNDNQLVTEISSSPSSLSMSPLGLASPIKILREAVACIDQLDAFGLCNLISVLATLDPSLVRENIFHDAVKIVNRKNNNPDNDADSSSSSAPSMSQLFRQEHQILSSLLSKFTTLSPSLPLHAYTATMHSLFSLQEAAILRTIKKRNRANPKHDKIALPPLLDEMLLGQIMGKLEDIDAVVNKLSTPNCLAVVKSWALLETHHASVRPSPVAVQNIYNHMTYKLLRSPNAVSLSELPEIINSMKTVNSLTSKLYSGCTKRFLDIVVGSSTYSSQLSSSSTSSSLLEQLSQNLDFENNSNNNNNDLIQQLYSLFDTLGTLAEEFIVSEYRGAGDFKKTWAAIRAFVIEHAFKFDLVSLVKCANAFAVLNSGDSALFGVLSRRLMVLMTEGNIQNGEGEDEESKMNAAITMMKRSFLTQNTLSASASAALLLPLVVSFESNTNNNNFELSDKLEPVASILIFILSTRNINSTQVQQNEIWYPTDSVVALDGLVRFYNLFFSSTSPSSSTGMIPLPPVVFSMWHRAFEIIRTSFEQILLTSQDQRTQNINIDMKKALDVDFENALRKIEVKVIMSAGTSLASSSLCDKILEDVMMNMLKICVLQQQNQGGNNNNNNSAVSNSDIFVDALACVVALSQKQKGNKMIHQNNADQMSDFFLEVVKNIAPYAVRLNEVSKMILRPSSVALAAHSLASVKQNGNDDETLGIGLLEWDSLNQLGKAAMRLFPERR